jgi:hypothetical protein
MMNPSERALKKIDTRGLLESQRTFDDRAFKDAPIGPL